MLYKTARRVVIGVVGSTVILIGVVLGPLPLVPAVIIIPLGLAILATEFIWARRLLRRVRVGMRNTARRVRRRRRAETESAG